MGKRSLPKEEDAGDGRLERPGGVPRFNIKTAAAKSPKKARRTKTGRTPAKTAAAGRKRKGTKAAAAAATTSAAAAAPLLLASGKTVIPLAGGLFATADVIVTTDDAAPGEAVAGVINFSGQSLPYSIDLHAPAEQWANDTDDFTKVLDRRYPARLQREIAASFQSPTARYDAVWRCGTGECIDVHRMVLAMGSPLFRDILQQETEDPQPIIDTPDFSTETVMAILSLFYTGKVTVSNTDMNDLTTALKHLGFTGQIVSVIPETMASLGDEQQQQEEEDDESYSQVEFSRIKLPRPIRRKKIKEEPLPRKPLKKKIKKDYDSDNFSAMGDDYLPAGDDDDWLPGQLMPAKHGGEEEDLDYMTAETEEAKVKRSKYFKSIKTPDNSYLFRTRGPGKGDRSYALAGDLFDGRRPDFIYACHTCYGVFDSEARFERHKAAAHPEGIVDGPCHTDSPHEFRCNKCGLGYLVKHIVWFCKHLKYCGINDDLSRSIVGPEEEASDQEVAASGRHKKRRRRGENYNDNAERLRITGKKKGKNVQQMSRTLVGKVVEHIWGCRTCYSIFLSESDLTNHRQEAHEGQDDPGPYWDPVTDRYTCPHCNQVTRCRHVVWFIHHMRRCKILQETAPQKNIKKELHEERDHDGGVPEDGAGVGDEPIEVEEMVDPATAILYKPYKIASDQAEWICQSLLGRSASQLHPCHICYTVFEGPGELEAHFDLSHPPGTLNRIENGPHFNKKLQAFNCPTCHKVVCRRQTTSVFFAYHLRKCNGHTFPMQKLCATCGKEFTSYSTYRQHVENSCEIKQRACHICGMTFVSVGRLNNHVKYVHSTGQTFTCSLCGRSYKRQSDLKVHTQVAHSTQANFSCEKCGKMFLSKKYLGLHMKSHLSKEERKHVCGHCGERFAKIGLLRNHVTKHSDQRLFACEVCGARVKTQDTLRQHRKKLHGLTTPAPKTELILDPTAGLHEMSLVKVEVPTTVDTSRINRASWAGVINTAATGAGGRNKAVRRKRRLSSSNESDTSADTNSPVLSPTTVAVEHII